MKRNRLSIVLLSLFLVVLLGSAFSIEGVSTNDLNFTFEKDIYYESTNPDYHESFNVRNQTEFTGHYPATYSFDGESGLEGMEISIIDLIVHQGGSTSAIIDSLNGHNCVLNLSDSNGAEYIEVQHTSSNSYSNGVIEFWWAISGITSSNGGSIKFRESGVILFQLFIDNNDLDYNGGSIKDNFITPNNWFHVKVINNDTANSFDCYVNGILEGDGIAYEHNSVIGVDSLRMGTGYNDVDNVYFDAIGNSWDKTDYTGTHFDVGTEDIWGQGICWDGTHFWVVGSNTYEVYQYTSAGVYTGTHFDVGTEDNQPMGITWDGTHFWVVGKGNLEVYQYTSAGVYTGTHFDVGTEDTWIEDIIWDGTHFWCIGNTNDEVYQYTSAGVYTGTHFDVGTEDNQPLGITWDGTHFWVVGTVNDEVYQYTSAGVYTGIHFDVGTEDTWIEGITWDGTHLWCIGADNDEVYQYQYVEFPYNIGDNMISTSNKTGILDVNRYEFKYKQWNDMVLTENGRDNVNTWTDIEGGGGDQVNYQNTGNGVIEILNSADYDEGTGIKKNDFTITSNRVNVSVGFELIDMTSVISSHFDISLNSSDGSEVVRIYIDKDGDLGYYDDGENQVVLNTGLLEGVFYEVNLFVNYYDGICVLRYNADGVFVDWYLFPLKTTGKSGLKGVRCELECSTSGHQVDLEYIGVYDEGVSVSWEFAFQSITPDNLWYYYRNSLLEFIVNSEDFCIYVDIFPSLSALERLITLDDYSGINRVDVRGELSGDYSSNLQPIFYFQFKNLEFFDFSIEGVKLNESSNSYWMDFTYENVNLEESYFYVDSDNRLQFSLICNDNYSEYIQATFDIQNIATENRSISFYSNINGNSKGYFALDYESAISTAIEFPYYARATRVILAQTEYINSFTILITDNDLDDDDACEGYITSVKLIYYPDIATTITTLSLLGILVPLIVMIAPPLALYKKFGSGVILPMFILMSLICVLTNLIPVWLFFIIAFSSIGFLLMKKKVEVAF